MKFQNIYYEEKYFHISTHFEIISTFPEIFPYISDLSSKIFNTCTAVRKAICWLGNNAQQKYLMHLR